MIEINTTDRFNDDLKAGKPIVIEFYGSNCPACKQMEKLIEEVEPNYSNVRFYKCNVETDLSIIYDFQVRSVPTIMFLVEGVNVMNLVGSAGKYTLTENIDYITQIRAEAL